MIDNERLVKMIDDWFEVYKTLPKDNWKRFKDRAEKGEYGFVSEPNIR